jgi:hypothetical protein
VDKIRRGLLKDGKAQRPDSIQRSIISMMLRSGIRLLPGDEERVHFQLRQALESCAGTDRELTQLALALRNACEIGIVSPQAPSRDAFSAIDSRAHPTADRLDLLFTSAKTNNSTLPWTQLVVRLGTLLMQCSDSSAKVAVLQSFVNLRTLLLVFERIASFGTSIDRTDSEHLEPHVAVGVIDHISLLRATAATWDLPAVLSEVRERCQSHPDAKQSLLMLGRLVLGQEYSPEALARRLTMLTLLHDVGIAANLSTKPSYADTLADALTALRSSRKANFDDKTATLLVAVCRSLCYGTAASAVDAKLACDVVGDVIGVLRDKSVPSAIYSPVAAAVFESCCAVVRAIAIISGEHVPEMLRDALLRMAHALSWWADGEEWPTALLASIALLVSQTPRIASNKTFSHIVECVLAQAHQWRKLDVPATVVDDALRSLDFTVVPRSVSHTVAICSVLLRDFIRTATMAKVRPEIVASCLGAVAGVAVSVTEGGNPTASVGWDMLLVPPQTVVSPRAAAAVQRPFMKAVSQKKCKATVSIEALGDMLAANTTDGSFADVLWSYILERYECRGIHSGVSAAAAEQLILQCADNPHAADMYRGAQFLKRCSVEKCDAATALMLNRFRPNAFAEARQALALVFTRSMRLRELGNRAPGEAEQPDAASSQPNMKLLIKRTMHATLREEAENVLGRERRRWFFLRHPKPGSPGSFLADELGQDPAAGDFKPEPRLLTAFRQNVITRGFESAIQSTVRENAAFLLDESVERHGIAAGPSTYVVDESDCYCNLPRAWVTALKLMKTAPQIEWKFAWYALLSHPQMPVGALKQLAIRKSGLVSPAARFTTSYVYQRLRHERTLLEANKFAKAAGYVPCLVEPVSFEVPHVDLDTITKLAAQGAAPPARIFRAAVLQLPCSSVAARIRLARQCPPKAQDERLFSQLLPLLLDPASGEPGYSAIRELYALIDEWALPLPRELPSASHDAATDETRAITDFIVECATAAECGDQEACSVLESMVARIAGRELLSVTMTVGSLATLSSEVAQNINLEGFVATRRPINVRPAFEAVMRLGAEYRRQAQAPTRELPQVAKHAVEAFQSATTADLPPELVTAWSRLLCQRGFPRECETLFGVRGVALSIADQRSHFSHGRLTALLADDALPRWCKRAALSQYVITWVERERSKGAARAPPLLFDSLLTMLLDTATAHQIVPSSHATEVLFAFCGAHFAFGVVTTVMRLRCELGYPVSAALSERALAALLPVLPEAPTVPAIDEWPMAYSHLVEFLQSEVSFRGRGAFVSLASSSLHEKLFAVFGPQFGHHCFRVLVHASESTPTQSGVGPLLPHPFDGTFPMLSSWLPVKERDLTVYDKHLDFYTLLRAITGTMRRAERHEQDLMSVSKDVGLVPIEKTVARIRRVLEISFLKAQPLHGLEVMKVLDSLVLCKSVKEAVQFFCDAASFTTFQSPMLDAALVALDASLSLGYVPNHPVFKWQAVFVARAVCHACLPLSAVGCAALIRLCRVSVFAAVARSRVSWFLRQLTPSDKAIALGLLGQNEAHAHAALQNLVGAGLSPIEGAHPYEQCQSFMSVIRDVNHYYSTPTLDRREPLRNVNELINRVRPPRGLTKVTIDRFADVMSKGLQHPSMALGQAIKLYGQWLAVCNGTPVGDDSAVPVALAHQGAFAVDDVSVRHYIREASAALLNAAFRASTRNPRRQEQSVASSPWHRALTFVSTVGRIGVKDVEATSLAAATGSLLAVASAESADPAAMLIKLLDDATLTQSAKHQIAVNALRAWTVAKRAPSSLMTMSENDAHFAVSETATQVTGRVLLRVTLAAAHTAPARASNEPGKLPQHIFRRGRELIRDAMARSRELPWEMVGAALVEFGLYNTHDDGLAMLLRSYAARGHDDHALRLRDHIRHLGGYRRELLPASFQALDAAATRYFGVTTTVDDRNVAFGPRIAQIADEKEMRRVAAFSAALEDHHSVDDALGLVKQDPDVMKLAVPVFQRLCATPSAALTARDFLVAADADHRIATAVPAAVRCAVVQAAAQGVLTLTLGAIAGHVTHVLRRYAMQLEPYDAACETTLTDGVRAIGSDFTSLQQFTQSISKFENELQVLFETHAVGRQLADMLVRLWYPRLPSLAQALLQRHDDSDGPRGLAESVQEAAMVRTRFLDATDMNENAQSYLATCNAKGSWFGALVFANCWLSQTGAAPTPVHMVQLLRTLQSNGAEDLVCSTFSSIASHSTARVWLRDPRVQTVALSAMIRHRQLHLPTSAMGAIKTSRDVMGLVNAHRLPRTKILATGLLDLMVAEPHPAGSSRWQQAIALAQWAPTLQTHVACANYLARRGTSSWFQALSWFAPRLAAKDYSQCAELCAPLITLASESGDAAVTRRVLQAFVLSDSSGVRAALLTAAKRLAPAAGGWLNALSAVTQQVSHDHTNATHGELDRAAIETQIEAAISRGAVECRHASCSVRGSDSEPSQAAGARARCDGLHRDTDQPHGTPGAGAGRRSRGLHGGSGRE